MRETVMMVASDENRMLLTFLRTVHFKTVFNIPITKTHLNMCLTRDMIGYGTLVDDGRLFYKLHYKKLAL